MWKTRHNHSHASILNSLEHSLTCCVENALAVGEHTRSNFLRFGEPCLLPGVGGRVRPPTGPRIFGSQGRVYFCVCTCACTVSSARTTFCSWCHIYKVGTTTTRIELWAVPTTDRAAVPPMAFIVVGWVFAGIRLCEATLLKDCRRDANPCGANPHVGLWRARTPIPQPGSAHSIRSSVINESDNEKDVSANRSIQPPDPGFLGCPYCL